MLKSLFILCCENWRVSALTQPEDLVAKLHRTRRVLTYSLAAAGLLLVAVLFLLEPGSSTGPRDVHITDDHFAIGNAAEGEILGAHIVGGRVAALQHILAYLINIGSAAAFGALLFSLVRKRGAIARYAIAWILMMGVVRPVSPPVQGNPPQAVSATVARSLLGLRAGEPVANALDVQPNGTRDPDGARAYVAAQVAFAEGDRETAARLARDVDAGRLGSPIEAPFRLQFLLGDYRGLTSVCFVHGCLLEDRRRGWLMGTAFAGVAALLAAVLAACLFVVLRRRLQRIDELRASGRRRDLGFA